MDTNAIISDLALKAKNSVVSYSELASIVADLDLETLKEVEVGLNNRGLSFVVPEPPENYKKEDLPGLNLMYLAAFQNSDKGIRDDAMDCLSRLNLPLVYKHANKYYSKPYYDDLVGAGNMGLVEAIRNYKFGTGGSFKATADIWIIKEINIWLKQNTHEYTIDPGQLDTNPVLVKIIADMKNENPQQEITYKEVAKRFTQRTKRSLSPATYSVFLQLSDSRFISIDDTTNQNSSSDDKARSLEEVIDAGQSLEPKYEDQEDARIMRQQLFYSMNSIEEDSYMPTSAASVLCFWIKRNWLQQNPRYLEALGIVTVQEVADKIIQNIKDGAVLEKQEIHRPAIELTPDLVQSVSYMISGCHPETRTRPNKKGQNVRKITNEVRSDYSQFRDFMQALSVSDKISLIKMLTEYFPSDILRIAPVFGVMDSGFVSDPSKYLAGADKDISNDDIGVSLSLTRATVGSRINKVEAQVKKAIKDMPDYT